MPGIAGFAADRPSIRRALRGPSHGRRWPIEDSQLARSILASPSILFDSIAQLPSASQAGPETLVACLTDIRDRYLHAHGLDGKIHVDVDGTGLGVPESPMRSILEHLVEGALRDNPSKDPFCHVGVSEKNAEFVTLFIRDNGRELPECSLEALRRFVRDAKPQHVPDRVYRLFLADNLVQWLGGRMWIGPTPNRAGSSVFIRLPRNGPQ